MELKSVGHSQQLQLRQPVGERQQLFAGNLSIPAHDVDLIEQSFASTKVP